MGRPSRIDRRQILNAALGICDDLGLQAVTMPLVAERLGVTAMALYRHIADKNALLDGLIEVLLSEIAAPDPAARWDARLAQLLQQVRGVARRHSHGFVLLLERPVVTGPAQAVREHLYAALRDAGVTDTDVPSVERFISTLALGFAAGEVSGRFQGRPADLEREYQQLLTFVLAGIESFRTESTAP